MEKWKLPNNAQDPLFQRTYLKPLFLQLRCPGCNKLYRIDTRDIKSSEPQFDCSACETKFTIETDENDHRKIRTKALGVIERIKFSSTSDLDFVSEEKAEGLRKCPKCEAFNPKLATDCRECGVIFAKIENLPLDPSMGALPSLVKAWQDLMDDYSNVTKHLAFVNQCEELSAVPYALKKYQDLKEAQPHDEIAQEMFHRVVIRSFAKRAEIVTKNASVTAVLGQMAQLRDQVNWARVLRLSPLLLSFVLIVMGAMSSGLRNLMGVGVSILFITLGLALITKGRIRWSDFWDGRSED